MMFRYLFLIASPAMSFLASAPLLSSLLLSSPLFADEGNGSLKRVVYLGDSLTAGYGLGEEYAFPALVEQELKEKGILFQSLNAGVSGDTTAGGLRRLNWVLKERIDVLFLALGANDSLRGLPPEDAKTNLKRIIHETRKKHPEAKIILAGMKSPPSMGREYSQKFDPIYEQIKEEERVTLLPFLLEGVAGRQELNLPDQLHPNIEGQKKIAKNVLPLIERALLE